MISTPFDVALGSLPIPFGLLTKLVKRDVAGLLYHCISDQFVPHVAGVLPVKTIRQFESDLEALQRLFSVVSYDDAAAHVNEGKALPPQAVLLTFDDGFSNAYHVVRPILKKRGLPATFFIVTDTLDNRKMADTHKKALCNYCMAVSNRPIAKTLSLINQKLPEAPRDPDKFRTWFQNLTFEDCARLDSLCDMLNADVARYLADHQPYLTREQTRHMADEGFTIGAHSRSHRELWLLKEQDEMEREITESCAEICLITGKTTAPFSFPYQSNRISRRTLAAIRARNPHVGLLFDTHGFRKDSPFIVPRQCFDNPVGAPPGGSNLALAMRHAYLAQLFWTLRGRSQIV